MDIAEKFEKLRYAPGTFTHRNHLECAYAMLVKYPFMDATVRYLNTIREMARRVGADKKFNTTITIAFLGLLVERMDAAPHTDTELLMDSWHKLAALLEMELVVVGINSRLNLLIHRT